MSPGESPHVAARPATSGLALMYQDHHGWLSRWLRQHLDCGDTAADLAQDTFVRVLLSMRGADAKKFALIETPRAYLATVAKRLVANHYRRLSLERAWLETLSGLPQPLAPSPEQRALMLEALHQVDAALAGLPLAARQAFLLSQLDGWTYARIAAELALSERTVQRYMERAFEACIEWIP